MAKFTIHSHVSPHRALGSLPPEFRPRARAMLTLEVPYTVVLFGHDPRDVVTSTVVRKALQRIDADERILALGTNFTAEARALLADRNALCLALGEFYWTDDSYNSIKE